MSAPETIWASLSDDPEDPGQQSGSCWTRKVGDAKAYIRGDLYADEILSNEGALTIIATERAENTRLTARVSELEAALRSVQAVTASTGSDTVYQIIAGCNAANKVARAALGEEEQ